MTKKKGIIKRTFLYIIPIGAALYWYTNNPVGKFIQAQVDMFNAGSAVITSVVQSIPGLNEIVYQNDSELENALKGLRESGQIDQTVIDQYYEAVKYNRSIGTNLQNLQTLVDDAFKVTNDTLKDSPLGALLKSGSYDLRKRIQEEAQRIFTGRDISDQDYIDAFHNLAKASLNVYKAIASMNQEIKDAVTNNETQNIEKLMRDYTAVTKLSSEMPTKVDPDTLLKLMGDYFTNLENNLNAATNGAFIKYVNDYQKNSDHTAQNCVNLSGALATGIIIYKVNGVVYSIIGAPLEAVINISKRRNKHKEEEK